MFAPLPFLLFSTSSSPFLDQFLVLFDPFCFSFLFPLLTSPSLPFSSLPILLLVILYPHVLSEFFLSLKLNLVPSRFLFLLLGSSLHAQYFSIKCRRNYQVAGDAPH